MSSPSVGVAEQCYVCSDGGVSSVTTPDATVQLPSELQAIFEVEQASCGQIESVVEVLNLVPANLCPELDRNDLRLACGCANAVPTMGPTVRPTFSPLAAGTPTAMPTTSQPTPTSAPVNATDVPVNATDGGVGGDGDGTPSPAPECFVCFDNGVSNITLPDVIIPLAENLPENDLIPDEASCADIQRIVEVEQRLPIAFCPLLDNEDLRQACGCENALSPPPAPSVDRTLPPTLPPTMLPDTTTSLANNSRRVGGGAVGLGAMIAFVSLSILA